MLSTYLALIQEQRAAHPNREKDYRAFPLARKLTTSTDAITDLARRPNTKFIGITERSIPLYSDVEDVYYYEFVNLGARSQSSFPDWEFWYIPVTKYTELLAATTPDKVPSYQVYNVDTALVETIETLSQPLIPYVRPNSTFFNISYSNNKHPLIDNFIYTGHSFLDKRGFMIYEYNDYKMFADDITITYYSVIRPLNFFIPSTTVQEYALVVDTSVLRLIGRPPGYLEIYTELPDLRATGKSTTEDFSPVKKWYEYVRYFDGQPFNKVLLPYAPTSLSIEFVKVQLNNAQSGLVFNQVDNIQALSINQTSYNNKISIQ